MNRLRLAVIVLAVPVVLLGCDRSDTPEPAETTSTPVAPTTPTTPTGPTDPAPEVLAQGRQAYQRGMCALCHGPNGTGSGLGPDLTSGAPQHSDGSHAGILAVLRQGIPGEQIRNRSYPKPMDAATKLVPESELDALATYVQSLRK